MAPRAYPVAHLVLVGTSVLRNLASRAGDRQSRVYSILAGQGYDPVEVAEAARRCQQPGDNVEAERCSSGDLLRLLERAGADAVDHDPYTLSAELNAMRPWHEAFRMGGRQAMARVVLFATDTGPGRLSARILREHLARLGADVEFRVVRDLGVPGQFPRGLRNLVDELRSAARRESADKAVALNITGGFKAETSVALIGAAPAGLDIAYYIHESMRETVVLPVVPLFNPAEANLILSARGGRVRDPPDWVARLASAVAALGLARIEDGEIVLDGRLVLLVEAVSTR